MIAPYIDAELGQHNARVGISPDAAYISTISKSDNVPGTMWPYPVIHNASLDNGAAAKLNISTLDSEEGGKINIKFVNSSPFRSYNIAWTLYKTKGES